MEIIYMHFMNFKLEQYNNKEHMESVTTIQKYYVTYYLPGFKKWMQNHFQRTLSWTQSKIYNMERVELDTT